MRIIKWLTRSTLFLLSARRRSRWLHHWQWRAANLRRRAILTSLAVTLASGAFVLAWRLPGCASRGTALSPTLAEKPFPAPPPRPAESSGAPGVIDYAGTAPIRAVWVARFHYRYPDDVRTIMRNCASLGFNTVLWQVRGEATVAYPSRLEPWSREYQFTDPGFDPLAIAVEEAHALGLRIEAWINVMPGWKGAAPPPTPGQVYNARPDWFMYGPDGKRQPLGDFYVILNPCLPEVRAHIVAVCDEIVSNYDVDGVHLDYVRYAWDGVKDASRLYPSDPRTLELYRQETGRAPQDDWPSWTGWRIAQLSRLVTEIRDAVRARRPDAALTAATWADPQRGEREYLQDALGWTNAGLLDATYPMAYSEDARKFGEYIGVYMRYAPRGRIIPGLGVYKHTQPAQLQEQLAMCAGWGGDFAVFSYDSLHATAGDRGAKPETLRAKALERDMRRQTIDQALRR